jgi:retron-type reverse transcriptase
MERIRRRSGDRKVNRLIWAFLKAGVLSEDQFIRTDAGTPQGGLSEKSDKPPYLQ